MIIESLKKTNLHITKTADYLLLKKGAFFPAFGIIISLIIFTISASQSPFLFGKVNPFIFGPVFGMLAIIFQLFFLKLFGSILRLSISMKHILKLIGYLGYIIGFGGILLLLNPEYGYQFNLDHIRNSHPFTLGRLFPEVTEINMIFFIILSNIGIFEFVHWYITGKGLNIISNNKSPLRAYLVSSLWWLFSIFIGIVRITRS